MEEKELACDKLRRMVNWLAIEVNEILGYKYYKTED